MFLLEYINELFTCSCICCKEQSRNPQIIHKKKPPIFRRIRKL